MLCKVSGFRFFGGVKAENAMYGVGIYLGKHPSASSSSSSFLLLLFWVVGSRVYMYILDTLYPCA